MQTIDISVSKPYKVFIGENLIENTANIIKDICTFKNVVIITDDIVQDLYLQTVKNSFDSNINVFSYTVKNGEKAKSIENLSNIWSFLAENKITRSDLIIALGGGVVGDLTGFVASTYLRGIKYLQIPTTLLSQVDSSVGGKTAINIAHGKNLVGSFYQPIAVICDINTLSTLSDKIFADGMGEVIKYGCIYDKELFNLLDDISNKSVLEKVIARCIEIKSIVVSKDEFDTGLRMILNFGHTIGHAVEKYHNFSTYTHGQAVAIGMVHITKLSEKYGLTSKGVSEKIATLCKKHNLPILCEIDNNTLFDICCVDKKNLNQQINLILLKSIGECFIKKFTHDEFKKFLEV